MSELQRRLKEQQTRAQIAEAKLAIAMDALSEYANYEVSGHERALQAIREAEKIKDHQDDH